MTHHPVVIPAEAGIQELSHTWIPAFAGMTEGAAGMTVGSAGMTKGAPC
jgi:hypothetical protein